MPPGRLVVASGVPSSDAQYHLRYPLGNAPTGGAALASPAAVASTATGVFATGIPLAGSGSNVSAAAAALSTGVHLASAATAASSASSALTAGAGGLTFPLIGSVNSGGDASFGEATTSGFASYSAAAPGTPAYVATQIMGRGDLALAIGGNFESWGTSASGRTMFDLVNTVKGLGTYPNVINGSRTPYVTLYFNLESQQNVSSDSGYQTLVNLIRANNWWLYETAGGTGTIVPSAASGSGFFNVNYSYAWPTAAGTVPLGFTICGNAYGTQSNSQGPARTGAQYAGSLRLTQNRTVDARWAGLAANGAASNADGIHLDNVFAYPNAGGNLVTQASWDGQNLQTNATIAAYPSGASSLMADGQAQFFATLQTYLGECNPGQTYGHSINFGSYANTSTNGNTIAATGSAMVGVVSTGMLEDVGGVAGFGWQAFLSATQIIANFDYGISQLASPARLAVVVKLPATDGSSTSWFLTGGVGQTVSTGTALEYQQMRCFMALSYMRNTYFCPATAGYNYALVRWYDESGDDSLTQVNVKRGWLGLPLGAYVVLPNGVWARQFSGGVVLFNDWANGTNTVTAAMLATAFGGSYVLLHGTQQASINTGAAFSSRTMLSGDGLFLKNA